MLKRLVVGLLASSALGLDFSLAAQAQTSDSTHTQVAGLETIIVTARKRAEDQQVVPISITAYDQSDLDRLNIRTIEDLRYSAPSVYIAPTTFRQDTLNVTIRGQRDFDSQ
jgi:iron complex outermembrane receptor protein